ncbi:MAG: SDR family oxidoreductase [Pseudomonadota bacterium]
MTTWLIIGVTSAMGEAFARKCADEGAKLIVTARNAAAIQHLSEDLKIRGASEVTTASLDLGKPKDIKSLTELSRSVEGSLSVGFFAGSMQDQAWLNDHPDKTALTFKDNLVGPAECLQSLAPLMIEKGEGTIIALSSVAGDRGRASNYVYGSAKAGFTAYLSGLRNRMQNHGIHVMTVKPGFVDTEMTWGLPGLFLVASPSDIAETLWKAAQKKRNTVYAPWFWWIIMNIIHHVPEPIFKKLKL